MDGWDFSIFWQAGRAILNGQDPYAVDYFYYPLPFAYLLSLFAIFPEQIAFWTWLLFNFCVLIYFFRRDFWQWILYVPVLHLFSSGQVELLFWALARGLGRHWVGALLGALITLKPQAAVIFLPWHLLDWARHQRRNLFLWVSFTLVLWVIPMLWSPGWIIIWLDRIPPLNLLTFKNSPGFFNLLQLTPALLPVLVILAASLFLWGQWQSQEIGRASAILASPIGMFYANMALLDCAPVWLLTPLSWLAAALTLWLRTFIPFLVVPISVIIWHLLRPNANSSTRQTE